MRLRVVGLLSTICCASAYSQPARLTGTLAWTEVVAGTNTPVLTPNGVLEPGESARVRFSAAFTPGVGLPVTYQLPGGGTSTAPVAGLWSAVFALIATGANGGTWDFPTAIPGFFAELDVIDPTTGSIILTGIYQPEPPLGSSPLPTNPLPDAWNAVWTPPNFDPRLVTFQPQPGSSVGGLFVRVGQDPQGNPLFSGATIFSSTFSQVQIPVVPAPAAASLVLLSFLGATRRRG